MSQNQRPALPEDAEVTRGASREQTRKLEQAMNLVASIGEDGDGHALDTLAHLVPAALQKVVEKLRQERQWDFLWFILEVEMIRQRIEELDRMIDEWQRENEVLYGEIDAMRKSIYQSRKHEQELRQAEDQRDFDRDPQTGRFRNKAVEQAVNDYERRYGPVDKNNPEMLVLVLQWAQQQEQQAQADLQLQIDDKQDRIDQNLRKIDKAEQEREQLKETYQQRVGKSIASLESKDAKLQARVEQQGLLEDRADRLSAYDDMEEGIPIEGDADIAFLNDGATGFLGADEPGDLQVANTDTASLDLEAGGIQCSIDMRGAFDEAASPTPLLADVVHEATPTHPQPAIPSHRPPGLA